MYISLQSNLAQIYAILHIFILFHELYVCIFMFFTPSSCHIESAHRRTGINLYKPHHGIIYLQTYISTHTSLSCPILDINGIFNFSITYSSNIHKQIYHCAFHPFFSIHIQLFSCIFSKIPLILLPIHACFLYTYIRNQVLKKRMHDVLI